MPQSQNGDESCSNSKELNTNTKDQDITNKENLHESKENENDGHSNFHEKSSSSFMTTSKNEDFMSQPPPQQPPQQQQPPIFEPPQQDFKFGMDYATGYRNGIAQNHNNWEESTMSINYGPPPILAAAPPTGLPPGIPTIRGRGQMNNFGGQQFNMPGRQYQQQQQQQQHQQQQQQQQQQNMFSVGRGVYGGGWGSPSHNPMPPNMSGGGWGGGGAVHRGGRVGGMGSMGGQRNKIFGAYGHQGNQYKVRTFTEYRICEQPHEVTYKIFTFILFKVSKIARYLSGILQSFNSCMCIFQHLLNINVQLLQG